MSITRRQVLCGSVALAGAALAPGFARSEDPIKLGSLLDTSGIFDAYGKPMDMAMRLAVGEINDAGGLLGRPVEVVAYDTQSDMALYTQYAQQVTRQDDVDVVHGGILSASREAIRQIMRRSQTLYFYNVLYEGGVCDRNIFINGVTPAQQVEALVPYAMGQAGGGKVYILAADYNYGQITARTMAARWSPPTSSRSMSRISARPSPGSRRRRPISSSPRSSAAPICPSSGNGRHPA